MSRGGRYAGNVRKSRRPESVVSGGIAEPRAVAGASGSLEFIRAGAWTQMERGVDGVRCPLVQRFFWIPAGAL